MSAPIPTPVPLYASPLALSASTSGGKSVPTTDVVHELHDLLPAGSELRHLLDADDARYAFTPTTGDLGVAA